MKTGRTDNWTAVHPNQNLEPLAANQPFASKDPARVSDIGTTLFKSGRGNRVQLVRPSSPAEDFICLCAPTVGTGTRRRKRRFI